MHGVCHARFGQGVRQAVLDKQPVRELRFALKSFLELFRLGVRRLRRFDRLRQLCLRCVQFGLKRRVFGRINLRILL